MSAYCKELLGYTTPTVVASSQALTIRQAETNAFSYKIWMDKNQADEYLLIENRQKTGFDLNIPGEGLLVYHIDKNLVDLWPASNSINVTNTHLGIKLYEADGLEQMATAVNRGSVGDPYPGSTSKTSLTSTTTPNTNLWSGSSSGVEIKNISASSATMTATAVLPVYNGYAQQFYRQYTGYRFGNLGVNTGYGMVKCTPTRTGTLLGVRIYSLANKSTTVEAAAFTKLTGGRLSTQVGSTVSGASAATDNFIQLNFSSAIDVTQNVPIYVRIKFTVASGGYATPIDISTTITNNSYTSSDGTTFTNESTLDIPVRVVFQSNSPMPIELTAFTASAKVGRTELTWKTATEINYYGFEIEKAIDRGSSASDEWTKIGFVEGNGTTYAPKSYSFVDKSASGKISYRLKQIDRDGKYEYSKEVEATVGAAPAVFALSQNYPNPFNPTTVINYSIALASHVTINVYDLLGREVAMLVNGQMEPGNYTAAFDASRLSSGVYFYRLVAGSFTDVKRLSILK